MNHQQQEGRIVRFLKEFSENTTLPGVRFAGETNRHWAERVCWIVAMLCCTVFCGIEMAKVWTRWNVSPVIITFASRPTRVEDLPFPAITICPKLQISKDDFDLRSALIKIPSNKSDQADVFKFKENLSNNVYFLYETAFLLCPGDLHTIVQHTFLPNQSHYDEMLKVTPDFTVFNVECKFWGNQNFDCKNSFRRLLTDLGMCYTFNMENESEIFSQKPLLNTTNEISNVKPVVNAHPLKGAITGLKIRLRMPEYLYQNLCRNSESSENFKVFVHSPYDYPSMQGGQEFIEVLGWSKTEVRLRAAISTTDPKLKVYSTNVRHCRFPEDQQLKNFKNYSSSHCLVECHPWAKDHVCGFHPHFIPSEPDKSLPAPDMCEDCLPSCNEVRYEKTIQSTPLDRTSNQLLEHDEYAGIFKSPNTSTFVYSSMHFYFEEREYLGLHRSEIFGFTDVLSSCGGLLGLFTGFSVITAIELVYFSTLRLCCNIQMRREAIKTANNQQVAIERDCTEEEILSVVVVETRE